MKYGRIILSDTNYSLYQHARIITDPDKSRLRDIYNQYCTYKNFSSVEPLFDFDIDNAEVVGYFDNGILEAFTLIQILDSTSVRGYQFAWTYHNPGLQLGWIANYHECALYKSRGFHYYYLGPHQTYKSQLEGYELLSNKLQ